MTRCIGAPKKLKTFAGLLVIGALAACASAGGPATGDTAAASAPEPTTAQTTSASTDSTQPDSADIPAGYGTLRQEQVGIQIQQHGVLTRLIPLDESVIRTLSPDSYKMLHRLKTSRRTELDRLARLHALRHPDVWYVMFVGLEPDARFSPTDVTITSAGREFHPLEVVPLSSGFGAQQLGVRQTQQAIYLFADGIDLAQPLTVIMGGVRTADWTDILRRIERERALIRSRATRQPPPSQHDTTLDTLTSSP